MHKLITCCLIILLASCNTSQNLNEKLTQQTGVVSEDLIIKPVYTTEAVNYDTDDPAIWINKADPSKSIIIGTDKDEHGALYAFDLQGKMIKDKMIKGLKRPNNVDIEYGLRIGDSLVDIAVVTERITHKLRVYSMPSFAPLDGSGIPVFEGETQTDSRDLMGISLYKEPTTSKIYAIVGRKNGTDGSYLWQYELWADKQGRINASLVRKFGAYSGKKEIEAIAVDDELGYVYYSDEGVGIRKYYANPAKGNKELALFGMTGFTADHEGISLYKLNDGKGYILVSDQGANKFQIFPREGTSNNQHAHPLIKTVKVSALESDGSETTSLSLNQDFPSGLFVAMSTDKTFHYYRWEDIAGKELKIAPKNIEAPRVISLKK